MRDKWIRVWHGQDADVAKRQGGLPVSLGDGKGNRQFASCQRGLTGNPAGYAVGPARATPALEYEYNRSAFLPGFPSNMGKGMP